MSRPRDTSYAAVLGLVVLTLAAVVIVAPRHPPLRLNVRERLHTFLQDGPGQGLWQIHTLGGTREYLVADHLEEPGCVLVAPVTEGDTPGRVGVYARTRIARLFMPGDERLFLRNYRLIEEPRLDEETGMLRAVWVPRYDWGGQTGRSLKVDPVTWEVWGLEDRSWGGRCVRCLQRLSRRDPGLEPSSEAPDVPCRLPTGGKGPTPAELASRVPFPLLVPTYLPAGFALVDAAYVDRAVELPPQEDGGEPVKGRVRLAWLSYSDGLANIDVATAPSEDMDRFEARMAAMRSATDEPEDCPPVPPAATPVQASGELIRRRQDSCRTVLRLDGRAGVSVRLLARNEIPEVEYIRVLASVERVMPSAPPPRDADDS